MSEELEALNKYQHLMQYLYDSFEISHDFKNEYAILVQALTPPTADEVCEALDKWYINVTGDLLIANINDFTYDKDEKIFYKRMLNKPHQMTMCRLDTNDCVQLREPLPPHLVTLIGRFYEGLEEK